MFFFALKKSLDRDKKSRLDRGSNPGPFAPKPDTLPSELPGPYKDCALVTNKQMNEIHGV